MYGRKHYEGFADWKQSNLVSHDLTSSRVVPDMVYLLIKFSVNIPKYLLAVMKML